ncbi:hypothetical protein [uncultured Kocuria sp.]|uniref:hypothetical protein n=1 Tax=uncultured Kocuria sp. TaxID=259305 RepID=UPI002595948C|nr:hypothetical protein [uncultured Kocuria sp.]MCT1366443.1 hypothetical protein [Rothia sp. p3-SID1597]
MMNIKGMSAVAVLGMTLLMTGCTSLETARDQEARAKLDETRNHIVYPLDEYRASLEQKVTMEIARIRIVEKCFRDHGISVLPVKREDVTFNDESREYGIWNELAAKNEVQFLLAASQRTSGGTFYEPSMDELRVKCLAEHDDAVRRVSPAEGENISGLADRLSLEAGDAAQKTPEWDSAVRKWEVCLKGRGLTPVPGEWDTEESRNVAERDLSDSRTAEELTRLAMMEARCSQESNMAQSLADIEASFQIPLIEDHQAELDAAKELFRTKSEAAEMYLSQVAS